MGRLAIVGIGPGNEFDITKRALDTLKNSQIIVGYTKYIELTEKILNDDSIKYESTGMTQEIERCKLAFEYAKSNNLVSMVCSGDSCVYGMAGILYELSGEYPEVELEVVSGVTAALSGSAVLGAALGHDFCVISLSDLLTDREVIEKRLRAAAMGDFCISLYNPASKTRKEHLKNACEILLEYKNENTICGYVKNIGREGETYKVLSLRELMDEEVDMFTTVFVGNSKTKLIAGKMVTPRGYKL